MRLGKVSSVNYFFGFFELKFIRKMGVDRRRDRARQAVPRPDAHDLALDPALAASADERMPKFMRVTLGQQPLHARRDRVEIGSFCSLKVDEGKHLPRHRRERYLAKHDVLS